MEQLVFYLFAGISVAAALLVVLQRRAIYSALALIVCFFSVAVLFFQLGAVFIAAIQVIVYAGAIMVLFLFVVMLIDPESEVFQIRRVGGLTAVGVPLAAIFAVVMVGTVTSSVPPSGGAIQKGEIDSIARSLFSDYLLPFEVTSILILVAVLGAMVLAKRTD